MSAKPVRKKATPTAPAAASVAETHGTGEAREMIDALNAAFDPDTASHADLSHTDLSHEGLSHEGLSHDSLRLSLPDALWESGPPLAIRDRGGEVSFANPAFKGLFDALAAAEALSPAEDLAAIIEGLGHPYTEDLVLRVDGKPHFFLAWHALVPHGMANAPYVVSQYFPADGVGRRLRVLQASDDRWRDLTRLASDIVWECSPDGVITYVSPRVLHLLGYHPHDLVGRPWAFLAGEGEDDALTARLSDPQARTPFRGLDLTLVDKDDHERKFVIQGLPVFDRDSGTLTGFRGTAQDLTDYVEHETALLKAVDAADTANRAKSEFLANMSHELRTPLNAIIGFTEIMAGEEFGPIGNPRYSEYLNSVLESGRHLLTLINQVLDVAKIEAGRLQLTEDAVDPAELVQAALRVVTATAQRRGIEILADVAETSNYLWADEGKLRQILLNLLSNSIKFTLEGGQIEIVARPERDGSYLFQVRDTGIGIEPAQFKTVLTPFEQIDSYLTRRFEGTGLGLPLCKALAEAHGGSLSLDSTPGEGTTVTVRFPASRVRQN